MKRLSIFLFAILFSMASFAQTINKIIESGELKVGMSGNQPPFCMKTTTGDFIGYEVDLAQALADGLGVKLNIVEIPFADLLKSLETGDVNMVMSGMTITPERSTKALFAGPYTISGKSLLTKSELLSSATNASDVNEDKFRIACMKGTNSEDYVKMYMPNVELVLVEDYDAGIKMTLDGEVDGMIADYPVCVMAAMQYAAEDLVTLDQPLSIEPIGTALPAGDIQFHNLIENYLQSLDISGTIEMLEELWFGDGSWMRQLKK